MSLLSAQLNRILDAVSELRGKVNRNVAPRIDMRVQVTSQAPTGAVGYRLMLPRRDGLLPPRLIPRRREAERRACYSITPFEYPDDPRLCDGGWYRIVWIDSEGNRLRRERGATIPGLCFVVGPVDPAPHDAMLHIDSKSHTPIALPTERESATIGALAEPSVAMALPSTTDTGTAVTEQTDSASQPSVTASSTEAAATGCDVVPSNTESSAEAIAAVSVATEPVTNLSQPLQVGDAGSSVRPPLIPGFSSEQVASIPGSGQKSKSKRDPFWDGPGKFAKQLESLAQVLYEQRLSTALASNVSPPSEPMTQLSREERKEIKRAASHPFWQALGRYLNARFARAKREGISVVASLPLVPTPLDGKDKRLMEEVSASPDKRVYLDYLYERRDALLVGDELPKEPASKLSSADRKRLAKIVADVRPIAEFLSDDEQMDTD